MKRTTDNKQNLMKLTRYNKKRFDGCEVILGLSHKEQMMILDLVFHNELFNKTTNPLLRNDLFSSMKELTLTGGGGKFRKKINKILEQYELGEYNV